MNFLRFWHKRRTQNTTCTPLFNNSDLDPDLDDFQLDVVYVLVGCVLAYVMATR